MDTLLIEKIKVGLEKSFLLTVFSVTVLISMHFFSNTSGF